MNQGYSPYDPNVEALQRYLRRLAEKEENEFNLIPIDGIFDSRTQNAVRDFQGSRGLPVTGTADKETFDRIYDEYALLIREKDDRIYIDFFPDIPKNYEADIGDGGTFITVLQIALDDLRNVYGTIPYFEKSGVYDQNTALAVKEFQRINDLPENGRVNRNTWNRISNAYNIYG